MSQTQSITGKIQAGEEARERAGDGEGVGVGEGRIVQEKKSHKIGVFLLCFVSLVSRLPSFYLPE